MTRPLGALVVDDEAPARRRLTRLLDGEPDVRVLGECRDGAEALSEIELKHPDLLFLDVQMPELDGFEVLEAMDLAFPPAVVFVTAYDQYALRAFEVNALDYLLKPFGDGRFRETLRRAREHLAGRRARGDHTARLAALVELRRAGRPLTRIAVRAQGRVILLPVEEIGWLEAADNYVRLHTDRGTYLLRDTLGGLELRLDPGRFLRIHRSLIVNLDRIRDVQPWFHGEHVLVLRDGSRLHSSRTYTANLRRLLRNAP